MLSSHLRYSDLKKLDEVAQVVDFKKLRPNPCMISGQLRLALGGLNKLCLLTLSR